MENNNLLGAEMVPEQKPKKNKMFKIIGAVIASILAVIVGVVVLQPQIIDYVSCSLKSNAEEQLLCLQDLTVLNAGKKADNIFKNYASELYSKGDYVAVKEFFDAYYSRTPMSKNDVNGVITDETLKEYFVNVNYQYVMDNKDNAGILMHYRDVLGKYDEKYYQEINDYIYSYFVENIAKGTTDAHNYFNQRYQNSQSLDDYKLLLTSLHYEVANYCDLAKTTIDADDTIFASYGFKTFYDFYNVMKENSLDEDILYNQCYDQIRLVGTWKGGGYTFTMERNGDINYNLPWFDYGDYYRLYNHEIVLVKDSDQSTKQLFTIGFVNDQNIIVYCHDDGSIIGLIKK